MYKSIMAVHSIKQVKYDEHVRYGNTLTYIRASGKINRELFVNHNLVWWKLLYMALRAKVIHNRRQIN